jgi:hypothetical protein
MTSRGGHALARGHGGVGHVAGPILTVVWWCILKKSPSATKGGLVPMGSGGGTWCHYEGCVKAKQLWVEHVAVGPKNQEFSILPW